MKTRLFLSFLLNLIFAWSLYILGWQSFDFYAFMLVIPLVLCVSLVLSVGYWAMWQQDAPSKSRLALNVIFNMLFAWVSYASGWYDKQLLPAFGNGLDMILLLAVVAVFVHSAIGNFPVQGLKRKAEPLALQDLSDSALPEALEDAEKEILRERR